MAIAFTGCLKTFLQCAPCGCSGRPFSPRPSGIRCCKRCTNLIRPPKLAIDEVSFVVNRNESVNRLSRLGYFFGRLYSPLTPLISEQVPDAATASTGEQPQFTFADLRDQNFQHLLRLGAF